MLVKLTPDLSYKPIRMRAKLNRLGRNRLGSNPYRRGIDGNDLNFKKTKSTLA